VLKIITDQKIYTAGMRNKHTHLFSGKCIHMMQCCILIECEQPIAVFPVPQKLYRKVGLGFRGKLAKI